MVDFNVALSNAMESENRPYMADFFKHQQDSLDYLRIEKSDEGWNVSSPGDLAVKVTLLSLDGLVVCPLLALASLVEGVVRVISGGIQVLISFIPFERNETFREAGKEITWSAATNGLIFLIYALGTFTRPAFAIAQAARYSWDTSCCRTPAADAEVEGEGEERVEGVTQ